ncbi:unnamed protein product, partial [Polarella glacialis]
ERAAPTNGSVPSCALVVGTHFNLAHWQWVERMQGDVRQLAKRIGSHVQGGSCVVCNTPWNPDVESHLLSLEHFNMLSSRTAEHIPAAAMADKSILASGAWVQSFPAGEKFNHITGALC